MTETTYAHTRGVVDAWQWTGANAGELAVAGLDIFALNEHVTFRTGWTYPALDTAHPGDWIVRDPIGRLEREDRPEWAAWTDKAFRDVFKPIKDH